MNAPDGLPDFAEADLLAVWRSYQEHERLAIHHAACQAHARREILKRAFAPEARVRGKAARRGDMRRRLNTPAGPITITPSSTYLYLNKIVDREFFDLIQRDELEAEWNQFVSHDYHIDRRWLKRLMQRGPEYRDTIEAMTGPAIGSPTITGPGLG